MSETVISHVLDPGFVPFDVHMNHTCLTVKIIILCRKNPRFRYCAHLVNSTTTL